MQFSLMFDFIFIHFNFTNESVAEQVNKFYKAIILLKIKQQKMNDKLSSSKKSIKSKTSKNSKSLSRSRKQTSAKFQSGFINQSKNTSSNTIRKAVEFLMKTAESQRRLQIIKQTLAEVPSFTPASLFYRFDAARKNYISEQDIQDFLIENKIPFKGSQLKTLFGRIDVNHSQTISLRQWQDFILPNQSPKLRYQTVRRPVYIAKPHEKLCKQIQFLSVKFFTEIIKQYSQLADVNSTLKSSYDFNSQNLFQLLSSGTGAITAESIKNFMQSNGQEFEPQQIGCIIKVIDNTGSAKVNSQDFDNFLATMGIKKAHQVFDELSPIPAMKSDTFEQKKRLTAEQIAASLLQRYKDNKTYAKGIDRQGKHIPGYSPLLDPSVMGNKSFLREW